MAISLVRQTPHITGNGVDSAPGSFASLPSNGNMIAILVSIWTNDITTGQVTDNQSNFYTKRIGFGGPAPDRGDGAIHDSLSIGTPSGTFTVTINPSNASDWFEGVAAEFSGLSGASSPDKTAVANGTNASPTVTGATTTQADELWLGLCSINDTSPPIGVDLPAGWTALGTVIQDANATIGHQAAYKIVSA